MKHPSNREMFQYWNERRGDRFAPDRADIEPSAIPTVLGDTLLLELNADETLLFQLAGTRLCALFGRELKGEDFFELWERSDQTAVRELVAGVMEEKVGCVAGVSGATTDDTLATVQLELVLLPLASRLRGETQMIGTLAPMAVPYWLGFKAISPLKLGTTRHLGAGISDAAPHFRAAAGRVMHGLTVYDGGARH
jgi:hypothetical protein